MRVGVVTHVLVSINKTSGVVFVRELVLRIVFVRGIVDMGVSVVVSFGCGYK